MGDVAIDSGMVSQRKRFREKYEPLTAMQRGKRGDKLRKWKGRGGRLSG